jgi:uncharacterized protein YbjT (DUF2867 family)
MAGWGTGSFENEDAQSWLSQLSLIAVDDIQPLLARAADSPDYLEAPEASVVIVAAEAFAALRGKPSAVAPKEITDWALRTKSENGSAPNLASLAVHAIQRVRTNSELKDLWLQADGLNEWSANLRDLEQRLAG